MQADEQNVDAKKQSRRSRSITRYPKMMPTYVVAFAMQETYDDLMTAQQMICKRSPQGSINSVTPTNSVKILDTSGTEKCTHVIDMPEDNDESGKIKDTTQCPQKAPETIMIDMEKSNDTLLNVQPEVIFKGNHTKRLKDSNKFKKKSHRTKRSSKFRDLNFKCKNCKSITKKIELHYTESKRNAVATDIVEKGLCNLSNVINQSRVLKKVLAVENLLEEQPLDDSTDEFASISSSTTKKGILSHSSDNTITRKLSSSSSRNFYSSVNTSSSVIEVSSENVIPYKTDVINVAVAVAFNKTKVKEHKLEADQLRAMNEEIYLVDHDLTRTPTVILPPVTLTSKTPSFERSPRANIEPIEDASSNVTLVDNNKKSSMGMSIDEDTFVIARTSSDFNKMSLNSNLTLTNSGTQSDETISGNGSLARENEYNKQKLLSTVINLGMFPESNPSTSKFNENAVIITKERKTFAKKDDPLLHDKSNLAKNILKKTFDVEKNIGVQKIITLPDEATIRSKLKANQEYQRKIELDFQNLPSTLADIWDRLIVILDAALKRIEESLPERIITEIKKVFDFDEYKNFVLNVLSERKDSSITLKENKVNKGVCADIVNTETDENLQCDLVQNQVIDQLMIKLYPEGPTDVPSDKFSEKVITKIFKDYFDAISPRVKSDIEFKEDTTVSAMEPDLVADVDRFHSLKVLLTVPIKFVKENAFVMTSVPTFLLILLCTYGLVVFIMKPL